MYLKQTNDKTKVNCTAQMQPNTITFETKTVNASTAKKTLGVKTA